MSYIFYNDAQLYLTKRRSKRYIKQVAHLLFLLTLKYFLKLFHIFKSLKVVLMTIVAILMMLANLATLGNKSYGVVISAHEVTDKILPHDSNYIADVAM